MFRDECEVEVAAGKGGDGMSSFHREKGVPRGGPSGGDGGDGGSVVFVARDSISSLLDIGRQFHYRARDGRPGGPRKCSGAAGEDLVVQVPRGTQVKDAKRGNLLRDLVQDGEQVVVAQGGRGGRGNARFATPTNQAPRHAESGRPGEERHLRLELKLVAEVGLVGLPNAGKSTLLSRVSAARPKIADYPFTTLEPYVGIAPVGDFDTLVLADLPGLIEGAAEGAGLGHRFLRHVERCSVLLHLVDVSPDANTDPLEAWHVVERELEGYGETLAGRPRLAVASKCEGDDAQARRAGLEAALGRPVLGLSSLQGEGLKELLLAARELVRGVPETDS